MRDLIEKCVLIILPNFGELEKSSELRLSNSTLIRNVNSEDNSNSIIMKFR